MSTNQGTSRPSCAASFVDPVDGERLPDHARIDAYGVELIGVDQHGALWWGTDRAAWLLHEHPFTVQIHGRLGRRNWTGHFIGTEEAAIAYAESHGVVVEDVESGDPAYERRQLNRYRQRQVLRNMKG